MFRAFQPARSTGRKGFSSTLALALALATGTAVGVAGFAEPAYAQRQPKTNYSKAFVAAYEPVVQAFNAIPEGGDYAAVKAQVPAVVAAIGNEDDRFAAGQLVLQLGQKSSDQAFQRQGLELLLASGKVAPEQLGQFHFFVGSLAYNAKDFAVARNELKAAIAAGFTGDDPTGLIIESYFQEKAFVEGISQLTQLAAERSAAGQTLPDAWLLRGLQVAYDNKLVPQANELSALLVSTSPTPKNWLSALQVVRELNQWGNEEILDLSRLMMATGAMQEDYDLAEYVEAADPRKLANEVVAALDAAETAGVIAKDEPRFAAVRTLAEDRAEADRADAPGLKPEAQAAATGTVALGAGDLFFSFGGYADAEAMYQLAIEKGGIDANRALTRKGIAQLRQGKTEEGKATLAQVQGVRAPLAKMWIVYADEQGAPATGG